MPISAGSSATKNHMNTKTEPLINAEPPAATQITKRMLRSGHAASLPRAIRKLFGLATSKRKDQWGSKAMRRGVQKSKEAKQRPARLAFIAESQRQALVLSTEARVAYVKRRTIRWRKLVERTLPGMFVSALQAAGLPMPMGPAQRDTFGGFEPGAVLGGFPS